MPELRPSAVAGQQPGFEYRPDTDGNYLSKFLFWEIQPQCFSRTGVFSGAAPIPPVISILSRFLFILSSFFTAAAALLVAVVAIAAVGSYLHLPLPSALSHPKPYQ